MTKDLTQDYNAKLAQDYAGIRAKVRGGMLPLVARIPAIEQAVSEYVLAQDAHYEELRRKAEEDGGDAGGSPEAVPIQLRDATALHRMADLVLHEELTWSHPDKMSIVEYPVMSGWQERDRIDKTILVDDMEFGDRRGNGRRKSHFVSDDGFVGVSNHKIPELESKDIEKIASELDVSTLLDGANLTERQRGAIDLVYFEGMTQEQASERLGISQSAVQQHISASLTKIKRKLGESTYNIRD